MRNVGGTAAHGNEFRGDADGDLLGRKRANFEAHGRMHAIKEFR
jgi:hypothetical protein